MTRVLVVDDTESNRFIFGNWLRRAGYEAIEAATGTEGLAIIESQSIDLVLLDVNLPDMSGFDVCASIKGHPDTEAVPVIHVSATATEVADRSAGLNRGADVYMVEPVERDELLAQVTALLRYSRARRAAERMAKRLALLHASTLEVHAAADANRLLLALGRGAAAITGGDAVVVAVVDGRGLAVVGSEGGSVSAVQPCSAGEAAAAATGSPAALARLRDSGLSIPEEVTAVPLRGRTGRNLGAIVFPGVDEEVELVLLQLSLAAAVAVENLRVLEAEHRIALTLQRSLLPDTLPVVSGLQAAARYDASSDQIEVGGDFFEVLELGGGRVAVAIGDVQGHSLQAATVMAELRNALRAYFLEGHGPATVLDRLDDLLLRFHPELTATVICGIVDAGARIVLSNAGHLPVLLASTDGSRFLEVPGTLLGFGGDHAEQTVELADGCLLVFVTDGLVERRLGHIDEGLTRLREVVGDGTGDLEVLLDRILVEVGPGEAAEDDVAVLAVRISS